MLSACTESSNHPFTIRRQLGQEVIILRKFLANPLPASDPKDADIFVVPALIGSACMGGLYDTHCTTPLEEFGDDLFELLPFYNAETRHRHLFLGSIDKRNLTSKRRVCCSRVGLPGAIALDIWWSHRASPMSSCK